MALSGPVTGPIESQRASSPSLVPRVDGEGVTVPQDPKIEDIQKRYNMSAPNTSTGTTKNLNVTSMDLTVSKYVAMVDASTDDEVSAPLELSKRGIHIPTRTR